MRRNLSKSDNRSLPGITSHQLAAASQPGQRTSDLLGNFGNLEDLFAQLEQPQVIELGNPLPEPKYLPRPRVGRCPAAHNRALLGDDMT